jgi:hypothetical protein
VTPDLVPNSFLLGQLLLPVAVAPALDASGRATQHSNERGAKTRKESSSLSSNALFR